jgi:hypothetical protein
MIRVFTLEGSNDASQYFSLGFPLPKGMFWPEHVLSIFDERSAAITSSIKINSLWDDNSIRWCHAEGLVVIDRTGPEQYFLGPAKPTQTFKTDCAVEENKAVRLKAKDSVVEIDLTEFLHIQQITTDGPKPLSLQPIFNIENFQPTFELIDYQYSTTVGWNSQPIHSNAQFVYEGKNSQQNKIVLVKLRLTLFYDSNELRISVSVHNPMPLIHNSGKWDLGNDNSLFIHEFGLCFSLPDSQILYKTANADYLPANTFSMEVDNSGGENWRSKNHIDHNAKPLNTERGAKLITELNGISEIFNELRPQGSFKIESNETGVIICIQDFWEKFPVLVKAINSDLSINFSTGKSATAVELQPGEIKSHELVLQLISDKINVNNIKNPPLLVPNSALYCDSKTIPWLSLAALHNSLFDVTQLGVDGANNFFTKREVVDEFGWRNFGDLYADHEALGYEGSDTFVSHYNNQYDPLQGFLKQWLLTGDQRWKLLADNLFDHIVNIDIYHTELDKPEYNGGLFWHTDHYVQAETASHRTYSKRQPKDVYQDHAGGGGPGSHHCYTSGLLLYYQLTGNELAKTTVLRLTKWITCFFEGDGTVLGTLLQYRNRASVRNPITGKYPLDRGTANYVNALLDSFELTGDKSYIERSSGIILQTFHYTDDFETRNFEDIENTWFYIVFMQSVAKYLWLTENVNIISHDYEAVKESFMHYGSWVCDYESPYLKNAHKLEFPNDTWTAQDLRKIMILKIYMRYVNDEIRREKIKSKISEISVFVESKLSISKEKAFTRVLALIMQNNIQLDTDYVNKTMNQITIGHETRPFRLISHLWQFTKHYSISREIGHLLIRFPKLNLKR